MHNCAAWAGGAFGVEQVMTPRRRFGIVAAALCGTAVLALWVGNRPGFVSAAIENTGAVPTGGQRALSLEPEAELAEAPQPAATVSAPLCRAGVVQAAS